MIRAVTIAALAQAALPAQAAANPPEAGFVFPAGAARGTTTEVVVGGRHFESSSAAHCSSAGVRIEVRSCSRPLTNQERNQLRELIEGLERQRRTAALDDADTARLADARKRLAASPRPPTNPQLAERTVLAITVAADAPLGAHDLRVQTPAGLGNPLRFHVAAGTESREQEPNDANPDEAAAAELPVTVNGQILPGDVDRFRVRLAKGQRLVARVHARTLIPYLADAVPGWFQATLALRDPAGRECAFVDDHLFDPDPQLVHEATIDGDHVLELRDALFRGRDDFVYRLAITCERQATTSLPGQATPPPLGPFPPLAEREPNDSPATAQAIELPHVVVGRIAGPNDVDVFRIDGHVGQRIVAEVLARRIGSPLDALLRVVDPRGRLIAVADDQTDLGANLVTHQADGLLSFTIATQGDHLLYVRDLQGKGGDAWTYRLRVGPPRPDFELRVVPSAVNLRPGTTARLTVHVLRRDDFAGPIDLALAGSDRGLELAGGRIPAGTSRLDVTLTAPLDAQPACTPIELQGTATIGGQPVVRSAVPADDRMQAFAWHHLVTADQLLLCLQGQVPWFGHVTRRDAQPLRLRAGGTVDVAFALDGARRALPEGLTCTLLDPPAGVAVAEVRVERTGFRVVLRADKKVRSGPVNLLLEATAERAAAVGSKPRAARQRVGILLPAVPIVIAP